MAYLSSSPPPMMPEDDDEDDNSFADGFDDLSESDNLSYDLTGLSDKLHSIPKEAMQITPKEFSRSETGDGNVVIKLNGLGVPQTDNDDEIPDLDDDLICDQGSKFYGRKLDFAQDRIPIDLPKDGNTVSDNSAQVNDGQLEETAAKVGSIIISDAATTKCDSLNIAECNDASKGVEDNEVVENLNGVVDFVTEDGRESSPFDVDSDISNNYRDSPELHPELEANLGPSLSDEDAPSLNLEELDVKFDSNESSTRHSNEFEIDEPSSIHNVEQSSIHNVEQSTLNSNEFDTYEQKVRESNETDQAFEEKSFDELAEQVQTDVIIEDYPAVSEFPASDDFSANDDFGDFANFEQASWVQPSEGQTVDQSSVDVPFVDETSVDPLSEDVQEEGNEDDFGDFDSADFVQSTQQSLTQTTQHILSVLHPKISTVITSLFSLQDDSPDACDSPLKVLNPNPVSAEDEGDNIWTSIYEIETTPALGMVWNKTNTQDHLMKFLKIDPRNIVLETKHRKYSPGNVPAFALGLSTSTVLQPVRIESNDLSQNKGHLEKPEKPEKLEKSDKEKQTESIPPANFDWQTSGLRDPLEQNGNVPTKRDDPPNANQSTSLQPMLSQTNLQPQMATKPRSREAAAILESFPLLNFMQAQTLVMASNDSGQH